VTDAISIYSTHFISISKDFNGAIRRCFTGTDRLPIDFAHDRIEAAERRDEVGDVLAGRHRRERREVRKRRPADLEPPGRLGAVRPEVDPEFALGGLDGAVGPPPRVRLERPGNVRADGPLALGPGFDRVGALLDDPRRLPDLLQPDRKPGVVVAPVVGDDLEVEVVVVAVGVVPPEVVVDPRPAGDGAGTAVGLRDLRQ